MPGPLVTREGIANLKAAAPPLFVGASLTRKGPSILKVNPKAIAFLKAHGSVPFKDIYPDGISRLQKNAPPLTVSTSMSLDNPILSGIKIPGSDINPAAVAYAKSTGLPFQAIYPHAPDWSSDKLGTKAIAQTYAKLSGKPFDGPGGLYKNWYHAGQSVGDWVNDAVNACGDALKVVVPIISTVLSFVPGVGTIASAALSAATALAEGEPLDEIGVAALGGAIPGGAAISPLYNTVRTVASGGDPGQALGSAISGIGQSFGVPIPPAAVNVISAGTTATVAIAKGQPPDQALLNAAVAQLPPEGQAEARAAMAAGNTVSAIAKGQNVANVLLKYGPSMAQGLPPEAVSGITNAIGKGIAVGHGQALQGIQKAQMMASGIANMANAGASVVGKNPLVKAAASLNNADSAYGFHVGTGMAQNTTTRFAVETARNLLQPAQRPGFDAALSLRIGQKAGALKGRTPMEAAGYAMGRGVKGATAEQVKNVASLVASHPEAESGAALAATEDDSDKLKSKLMALAGIAIGAIGGAVTGGWIWGVMGAAGVGAGELWWLNRSVSKGSSKEAA